jgi:hypothetical protein
MKKSITQLYQEATATIEQKPKAEVEPVKAQEGVEKFELWSKDAVSEEIIRKLQERRSSLLTLCMEMCPRAEDAHYILSHLREARTITQTINLMQTGEYK